MKKSKEQISLRAACMSDLDFIREINILAYKDIVVRTYGSWDDGQFDKEFKLNLAEIINLAEKRVGYICTTSDSNELFIKDIAIDPYVQGQGIGSYVLKQKISEAFLSKKIIRLQVFKKNIANKLYKRLGFKEVGETDTHILYTMDL